MAMPEFIGRAHSMPCEWAAQPLGTVETAGLGRRPLAAAPNPVQAPLRRRPTADEQRATRRAQSLPRCVVGASGTAAQ